jgi:hypothetical protein
VLLRLVMLMLFCSSCDGTWPTSQMASGGGVTVTTLPQWKMPRQTQIMGGVMDVFGQPISGARIASGDVSAITDLTGKYVILVAAGPSQRVSIEAKGMVPTVRHLTVVDGEPTALHVVMKTEAEPIVVDSTVGGTATAENGASVVLPPDSVVDPDGNPVSGPIDVVLTYFDPSSSGDFAAFPGQMVGNTDGDRAMLASLSMMDVTMRQGDSVLQVAEGKELLVSFPAPKTGELPATSPLWSMNPETGEWVREGKATLDAVAGVYRAAIPHMTPWNCDIPFIERC